MDWKDNTNKRKYQKLRRITNKKRNVKQSSNSKTSKGVEQSNDGNETNVPNQGIKSDAIRSGNNLRGSNRSVPADNGSDKGSDATNGSDATETNDIPAIEAEDTTNIEEVVKNGSLTGENVAQVEEKKRNRDNKGRFVAGNNANTGGFQVNPQNAGYPKGQMRAKNMLKKLLEMPVDADNPQLDILKKLFPSLLDHEDEALTMRALLEMQQLSLVFSKNGTVAQNAINAIKDRVDGKVINKSEHDVKIGTGSQETFLGLFMKGDVPDDIE